MAMLSKGEKEVLKVIKQGISTTESISSLQSTNNQLDNSIATTEELLHVGDDN